MAILRTLLALLALLIVPFLILWLVLPGAPPAAPTAAPLAIEVENPPGSGRFEPADFSVVGSVTPLLRIGGLPAGATVVHLRPDGRAAVDRDLGPSLAPQPNGTLLGQAPLISGINSIELRDGSAVLASATMLNYPTGFEDLNGNGVLDQDEDADGDGVLDPGEDTNNNGLLDIAEDLNGDGRLNTTEDLDGDGVLDPGEDLNGNGQIDPVPGSVEPALPAATFATIPGTSLVYVANALELDFVDQANDAAISDFVRRRGLRPAGVLVDPTLPAVPKLVSVAPPAGADALAAVKDLNGLDPTGFDFFPAPAALPVEPPLEAARLIMVDEPPATGEALTDRLIDGAAAAPSPGNAGDRYDPNTGGFDNDNDGGIGQDFDELNIHWPHFFMDSFAAHRLVDELLVGVNNPRRPLVALVDTGLGDGTGAALADIAAARIVRPTNCAGALPGGACQVVGLNRIPDAWTAGARNGDHGTGVAHLAAGAGQRILGIGKDIRIRPIKAAGRMSRRGYARGLQVAAADRAVRVVLLEYQESDHDANNNGTIDPAELPAAVNALNNNRGIWRPGINAMLTANPRQILVVPAGNRSHDSNYSLLAGPRASPPPVARLQALFHVPLRGTRAAPGSVNALVMGVANSTVQAPPLGLEARARSSNFGDRISVAAPSNGVPSLAPNQGFRSFGGTSGAAPQVAGLAGELIFLDDNRNDVGPFTPLQIVELIEGTADDLGTDLTVAGRTLTQQLPNDAPGDGADGQFGFGRINAWKAVLSAVNGGLARESAPRGDFVSLTRVDEAGTQWYGLRILTGVLGATVWLDGEAVADARSNAPNEPQVTAYRGVRGDENIATGIDDDNDGTLDEDPVSGVVPVGSAGGPYVLTLSLRRDELLAASGQPRTLSLRRPGQTAADAPFFNIRLDLDRARAGQLPGVVFDDFVFEITPADFGDASPAYPVRLAENGARHLNSALEWLGRPDRPQFQSVTPELDATDPADSDGVSNIFSLTSPLPDRDRYDDGVVFYPLSYRPGQQGRVDLTACVSDRASGRYAAGDSDRLLFLNGWIDWNTNGRWEEGAEHVVDGLRVDPSGGFATNRAGVAPVVSAGGRCATFQVNFPVPLVLGDGELWARVRLDYGEDAGRNDPRPRFRSDPSLRLSQGAARYGEVEDYLIGSDFGDAPKRYPTEQARNGARHLDIHREWLGRPKTRRGDGKTREPDACLAGVEVLADQDGIPNIGLQPQCLDQDRDVADESFAISDLVSRRLLLGFTVQSGISSYGYDLMGQDDDGDGRVDEDPQADGVDEDGDGSDGEDGANPIAVSSLDPADPGCARQKTFNVLSTPPWSGGKGRYHAGPVDEDRDGRLDEDAIDGADGDADRLVDEDPPGAKPLILNVFVDWNGDGDWSGAGERVVSNARIAPETFGPDQQYTLGEPFTDANHDGARNFGEPWDDSAGVDAQRYQCLFDPPDPDNVANELWVRVRLGYAELGDQTIPAGGGPSEGLVTRGIAHNTEINRNLAAESGGALFGEVEDLLAEFGEIDEFEQTLARFTLEGPFGAQRVTLSGPTTIAVGINQVSDTDNDGREQVPAEIAAMHLTGSSPLGPLAVRVRDPGLHPGQRSLGEIEEAANATPGVLDVPPFAPSGTADSYFDVYFEVDLDGQRFHTHAPKRMHSEITFKPPKERYRSPDFLELYDEDENATGIRIGGVSHIPDPEHPAIEDILFDLKHENPVIRLEGIADLARLEELPPVATFELLELMEDPDGRVRAAAELVTSRQR